MFCIVTMGMQDSLNTSLYNTNYIMQAFFICSTNGHLPFYIYVWLVCKEMEYFFAQRPYIIFIKETLGAGQIQVLF